MEQQKLLTYWLNREDARFGSDSARSYDKKKAVLNGINHQGVQDFFAKYFNIYFPDIDKMTPFEKINNILEQKYNLNSVRFKMGLDNYKALIEILSLEDYPLINQAADLKKMQEVIHVVSGVSHSELARITDETRRIAVGTIEKGEDRNNDTY